LGNPWENGIVETSTENYVTIVESVELLPNRIAVDTEAYEVGLLTAVRLGQDGVHFLQTAPKTSD